MRYFSFLYDNFRSKFFKPILLPATDRLVLIYVDNFRRILVDEDEEVLCVYGGALFPVPSQLETDLAGTAESALRRRNANLPATRL